MVRNYKRKTTRGGWTESAMKNAVTAVLENRMGYRVASKHFHVPQTTLERKVKNVRENPDAISKLKLPLGPKTTVFTSEEENELVEYLLDMESRLYGLTAKDLKSLVYQLAKKNNKPNPFNDERIEAGKDWLAGFLKRHPELIIRKPENTSAARAAGFNKGKIYDEYKLTPDRVYNCDETGISVVPKSRSKVIAKTGKKQVGAMVSGERGSTITVEICFNATGHYMPPMMIFPRKRMKPELMVNAPAGAWGVCSDSGWMTADLFYQWFEKFIEFSKASKDRPVLLLLDAHSTHTQNIELIKEARKNGVVILCFPPHTTHRLQVADVVFMRPLSMYYDRAVSSWLPSNPGLVVSIRHVAELFGKAFIQAATMATAVNGFNKCGIWPYDPSVFTESDFVASLTTDIAVPAAPNLKTTPNAEIRPLQNDLQAAPTVASNRQITSVYDNPQPGCSTWSGPSVSFSIASNSGPTIQPPSTTLKDTTNFQLVSPKKLLPIPMSTKTTRRTKRRGKTAIITSSPYKKELEENIKTKLQKIIKNNRLRKNRRMKP